MRKDFRETLKYRIQPDILIRVERLQFKEVDSDQKGEIDTVIKIGGVSRNERIEYQIFDNQDGILNLEGKIRIDMADYKLEYDRNFLGFIEVNPYVDITFLFNFVVYP